MELHDEWARGIGFAEFLARAEAHAQLWRDVTARAAVPPDLVARAEALPAPLRLLVILEDWCGDAINTIPYLARLAEMVPGVELRVVGRDDNPALMDAHLSPTGGRAIPVVIALDAHGRELGWWGSRPAELQAWVLTPEARAMDKTERYRHLRRWYARDRGRTTLHEVLTLLEAGTRAAAA